MNAHGIPPTSINSNLHVVLEQEEDTHAKRLLPREISCHYFGLVLVINTLLENHPKQMKNGLCNVVF